MARGAVLWRQDARLHLRLRSANGFDDRARRIIEQALEEVAGVRWARVNGRLGCVVIACEDAPPGDPARAPRLPPDPAELARVLAAAEAPFASERGTVLTAHPERHPGDGAPLRRTAIELAIDAMGVATSVTLRRLHLDPLPIELDLAALLELGAGVPVIRRAIERAGSIAGTEFGFEVARAVLQALLQSESGPVIATARRLLRIRELAARRGLWGELEPSLCGHPDAFADANAEPPARAVPCPAGPIERYTDKASVATLGAFVAGWLATHDVEGSSASIFAGLPKPARYGRDAFAAHLGYRLARAGVLVIEPHLLRRLDRLDTVLFDERLWAEDRELEQRLLAAARAARLRAVSCSSNRDAAEMVRSLQRDGHGVCAIGIGPWSAFAPADFALAVGGTARGVPWAADVIGTAAGETTVGLLETIDRARRVSEQGVALAMIEAALGVVFALAGLEAGTTRRIMKAVDAVSIFSIVNGVRHAHAVSLPARARAQPPSDVSAGPASQRSVGIAEDAAAPGGGPSTSAVARQAWHALAADDVLAILETTLEGLGEERAALRREPRPPSRSALRHFGSMVAEELSNPMAPVLGVGAGLSLASGGVIDAALIASVLAINGVIGGAQRFRADRALEALSNTERSPVRVRRGAASVASIDPLRLVVGDVVELSAGEVVPADCRILQCVALEVDESSLTGESLPVAKDRHPVSTRVVADRRSMLYAGTAIAAGQAVAVVVATERQTEAGRAAVAAGASPPTGVEARLARLTELTAPLAAAAGLLVASSSLARGRKLRDVVGAGVGLAVAAVPEGLPLLSTMAQLAAARRLSARGALVRQPRAVEALGRIDILCADKTGTLTEGRIKLRLVSDGHEAQSPEALGPLHRRVLATALRASPSTSNGEPIPHLTDRALVEGASRAKVRSHDGLSGWSRLDALPFEPRRGLHAGLAEHDGGKLLSVKGAPEVLLPRCSHWRREDGDLPISEADHRRFMEEARSIAARGFRVLAVAERIAKTRDAVALERLHTLRFCGFVAFADPVRATARLAVSELRRAGVEVIMVTGDHPSTAEAIASELGLGQGRGVLTGTELDELGDDALDEIARETSIFARVTPSQKVRIVAALQRAGKVVAMTGDGANDAPAIRLADVGIALGEGSTAAARAAADLVVTDSRIETIVAAVLEGRALWASVRDAVAILVGGNVGEIAFSVVGGLVSGASPLNARQLLFVNLVTDTLPALAIALRPPPTRSPEDLVREGPEVSLGDALSRDIGWRAGITAATAGTAWLAARMTGGRKGASTVAMMALTGAQLVQTLVVGSRSWPVVATSLGSFAVLLGVVQLPGVSQFFGCRPLGPLGLAQAGLATAGGGAIALFHHRWTRRG